MTDATLHSPQRSVGDIQTHYMALTRQKRMYSGIALSD